MLCDSPTLLTFRHGHAFFYAIARGWRECTEPRRRFGEDAIDPEKSRGTCQSKRLSDEAEIDSVDSLICAYEPHMRMGDMYTARLRYRH